MMKLTLHARFERMDRIEYILNTVGFGEPMVRTKSPFADDVIEIITTTGVMLIVDKEEKSLITAYIPSIERITKIYGQFNMKIPYKLYKTICYNERTYRAGCI